MVAPAPANAESTATVKTFKRTAGQVWLMPHNPAFDPIPGNDDAIRSAALLTRVVASAIEQNYDPDKDRIVPFFLRKDKKERVSPVAIP